MPKLKCSRCGERTFGNGVDDLCDECIANDELESHTPPEYVEGVGGRMLQSSPVRVCPECGSDSIFPTYDGDMIGCDSCGYHGRLDYGPATPVTEDVEVATVSHGHLYCPCGGADPYASYSYARPIKGIGNRDSGGFEIGLMDGDTQGYMACNICHRVISRSYPYEVVGSIDVIVGESFDSSSLGGGGVADLRSDPIPQSVPNTAEERDEEDDMSDEEEARRDAVLDPNHISMKADMWGTIPDSGLPSSVGSIGQMPIRLESVDGLGQCSNCVKRGRDTKFSKMSLKYSDDNKTPVCEICGWWDRTGLTCPECGKPYTDNDVEIAQPGSECSKCFDDDKWADDDYEEGIGGRTIVKKAKRQCPSCGSHGVYRDKGDRVINWLYSALRGAPQAERDAAFKADPGDMVYCNDCGYSGLPDYEYGAASPLEESVEMTCAECGNAVGGDGLCTDYTCFGSEESEQVSDISSDQVSPQDHHLDPTTNTNTMWKGLGDEAPDYRL